MPFKRPSKEQRKDYLELSEYVGDINIKKIPTPFHIIVSAHYPCINRTLNFCLRVGEYSIRSSNLRNDFL